MGTGTDFWVRLAGYPLWLASPHAYTVGLFRDYRIDPSPADTARFGALCRAAGWAKEPLRPGLEDAAPVPAGPADSHERKNIPHVYMALDDRVSAAAA